MKGSQQARRGKSSQLSFRGKSESRAGMFAPEQRRVEKLVRERKVGHAMVDCLLGHYERLLRGVRGCDEEEVLATCEDILFRCQEVSAPRVFVRVLLLLAHFYFALNDLHKSAFFARQGFLASHSLRDCDAMVQSLVQLAKLANTVKQYDHGLLFLKKALQYAWHSRNALVENQLYDLIGIALYYQGEVQSALIFHNKSMSKYA